MMERVARIAHVATLAGAGLLLGAASAGAAPFTLGGVDAQSQYTANDGIFTFNDTINGANPVAEAGTVTSSSVAAIPTGNDIDLDLQLDTSGGYDPSSDGLLNASFAGSGPGAEIQLWDSGRNNVLLALDVDFVDVTGFFPAFPGGSESSFSLGSTSLSTLGTSSRITVAGGTQAAAVGGVGTEGVLQLGISNPDPAVTSANTGSYLSSDFTVIDQTAPSNAVTWDMAFVPEPGTSLLVGAGLLGLALRRRG